MSKAKSLDELIHDLEEWIANAQDADTLNPTMGSDARRGLHLAVRMAEGVIEFLVTDVATIEED